MMYVHSRVDEQHIILILLCVSLHLSLPVSPFFLLVTLTSLSPYHLSSPPPSVPPHFPFPLPHFLVQMCLFLLAGDRLPYHRERCSRPDDSGAG